MFHMRRASGARWVLFMPAIPARPASVRVKVWRRLQAIGAIGLRGAVYALPNRAACVELFEWVGRELRALGGQAAICEGRFLDDLSDDDIARRFVAARDADYRAIADAAATELAKRRRTPRARAETHARLAARLAEVRAIDYLDAPGRARAEARLAQLARTVAAPRSPELALAPMPRPRGATWVTRAGVHVDRVASAWLVVRFIDPRARFKFVPAKGYVPRRGELRFDMFEAELTHVGDRCTFEVILERMGPRDPALRAIADVVHDLDLKDGRYGRDETAGVAAMLDGVCRDDRDDRARLAAAFPLFDALHATFAARGRAP